MIRLMAEAKAKLATQDAEMIKHASSSVQHTLLILATGRPKTIGNSDDDKPIAERAAVAKQGESVDLKNIQLNSYQEFFEREQDPERFRNAELAEQLKKLDWKI